jgi:hypothetical protein
LSLIPANIRRQQNFDRKKPYMVLGFIAVLLMLLVVQFGIVLRKGNYDIGNNNLKKIIDANKGTLESIESAQSTANDNNGKMDGVATLLLQQSRWPAILNEIYRLKPDNLWITSIKPIIGQVKAVEIKSASGSRENPDDMFGGDMFGGEMNVLDSMGGSGGGGSDSGTVTQIGGLEISGCCVQVDERNAIFTLGPIGTFPFQVDKPLPTLEGGDAPSEGDAASKISPQEMANKLVGAQMSKAGSPAAAFEVALRMSQLFDSDPKMTLIKNYSMSGKIQNLTSFKMQVKFSFVVDFLQFGSGGGSK